VVSAFSGHAFSPIPVSAGPRLKPKPPVRSSPGMSETRAETRAETTPPVYSAIHIAGELQLILDSAMITAASDISRDTIMIFTMSGCLQCLGNQLSYLHKEGDSIHCATLAESDS
jgi:hypothetical protein